MKKINILPLAEKINADNLYIVPSYKKIPSLNIPTPVYTVLGVISFIAIYTDPFLGMILFGAIFLIAGIDSKTGKHKNGRTYEKVLWQRLPLFLMGIFFVLTGVYTCLIETGGRNSDPERNRAHYLMLFKLFIVAGAVLAASRLLKLVVSALAIKSRRNTCGTPVHVEPDILAVNCPADTSDDEEYQCSVPVYKYYYEGNGYRFKDYNRELYFFSSDDSSQVYVDPKNPDRYYSPNLFAEDEENLIEFLKILGEMFIPMLPYLVVLLLKQ